VIVAFGLWPRFGKIAYPISSAVHDAIYENFPKQSPFFKVHNVLQKCFSGRIFAASQPLISAESAVTTRDPSQYSAMIDEMQDRVFEKIDVQLIGQPLSTVVNHVNTDPEYSRESIGMLNQKEHGPKERQHMNVAFGELYLQRILEHLQ
jgi:hypothetical protein